MNLLTARGGMQITTSSTRHTSLQTKQSRSMRFIEVMKTQLRVGPLDKVFE